VKGSMSLILSFTYKSVNHVTPMRNKVIGIRELSSLLDSYEVFHGGEVLSSTGRDEELLD